MKLTQHTNYAIRMLMYCHSKDGLATVGEIAKFYGLSELFLAKILKSLTAQGFMESVRGRNGGIRLARNADRIFVGDVVKKIEENFDMAECFQNGEPACPLIHACGLNEALSRALAAFFEVLNEYSIADLVQKKHNIGVLTQLRQAY